MVRLFVPVPIAPDLALLARRTLCVAAQLVIRSAFGFTGSWIVRGSNLTLPGNVVGMALLCLAPDVRRGSRSVVYLEGPLPYQRADVLLYARSV